LSSAGKAFTDGSAALNRIQLHWLSHLIHDLRSPSFAARGYVKMVVEGPYGPLADLQTQYLSKALDNLSVVFKMVNEMSDFPGENDLSLHLVSICDVVREAVDHARPAALARNATFLERIPVSPLSTAGDPEKLALAARDLLWAAVNFTGTGGTIEVEVREQDGKILLHLTSIAGCDTQPRELTPDLSSSRRTCRLHGGAMAVRFTTDQMFQVICELPMI